MRYTRQSQAIHFHFAYAVYQPATRAYWEEKRLRGAKHYSFVFLGMPVVSPLKIDNGKIFSAGKKKRSSAELRALLRTHLDQMKACFVFVNQDSTMA